MATCTPEAFRLRYPIFETVTDAQINLRLTDYYEEISASVLGADYGRAACCYVAHWLTVDGVLADAMGGGDVGALVNPGAVKSEKTGDLAVSYGSHGFDASTVPPSLSGYLATSFGVCFVGIMMKHSLGPMIALG